MPNHVTNILTATDVAILPIYTEDETGTKQFDFSTLIPIPDELLNHSSPIPVRDVQALSCYMTKCQDVEVLKTLKEYSEKNYLTSIFMKPHILSETEIKELEERFKCSFDDMVKEGKRLYDNIVKYGFHDWYYWSVENWGTKWNAYNTEIYDDHEISFNTAWSPPEPIIKELSKKFPDTTFHLLYCDEFIGNFAGEQSYLNGELEWEIHAEGLDHPEMPMLLYKLYDYTVMNCVYVDENGEIQEKKCNECKHEGDCMRLI